MTLVSGKCETCGDNFIFGVNGLETAKGEQCDLCAGVVRAINGYVLEGAGPKCCCFERTGDNDLCQVHVRVSSK